jgi:hypothetical protein
MKSATAYLIAEVLSLVATFVSFVVLMLVLAWLFLGGGVIACGRGIFDSPTLFTDLAMVVGVPGVVMFSSLRLFFWFAKKEEASTL